MTRAPAFFQLRKLEDLDVEDEASFRHVGLYRDLAAILQKGGYAFRVLPERLDGRWDRAVFLNLTFWGATDGGDILTSESIPADVVAHVAWHHLAAKALTGDAPGPLSPAALFLGESIASAFDLYLVGRLVGHAPASSFLETQVPAMADAAAAAGLSDEAFEALVASVTEEPERAFEDLRALLFDATSALVEAADAEAAAAILERFDAHRFAPLLHHYELSNWVLYARAYGRAGGADEVRAKEIDRVLRESSDAVTWLDHAWVRPALGG